MIVDVRRGVELGVTEDAALVAVPRPEPRPGTAFPPRRLTLRGVPVFELALWCGTCPAVFQKLSEPDLHDVEQAFVGLGDGVDTVGEDVLDALSPALPRSSYTALLLDVSPTLVLPGGGADYFTHEQVATWGVDPVSGAPEDPGTPYYRGLTAPTGTAGQLYELVVPLVPPSWNDATRVEAHADQGAVAPTSTAVAYTLLDVVQPATDAAENVDEHWVLTHFLLDGHHRMEAAARAGRPVRLLSLVDERVSLATSGDLARLLEVRAAAG